MINDPPKYGFFFPLAIFLAKMKALSLDDLCEGIAHMNKKIFTMDQVKQLMGFIPNKDDVSRIGCLDLFNESKILIV